MIREDQKMKLSEVPEAHKDTLRVVVVDDHPVMNSALRAYIDSSSGLMCVGEARDGRSAVERVHSLRPDVVVMDLNLPELSGVEATQKIKQQHPEIAILAVTTFSAEPFVVQALRAGASGYLVKDAEPAEIVSAIRDVYEGMAAFSPVVAHQLMLAARTTPVQVSAVLRRLPTSLGITERQLECLRLLGKGKSNQEIAEELGLSEATVKAYMSRMMHKLDVRDRVQLLIRSVEWGLVHVSLD